MERVKRAWRGRVKKNTVRVVLIPALTTTRDVGNPRIRDLPYGMIGDGLATDIPKIRGVYASPQYPCLEAAVATILNCGRQDIVTDALLNEQLGVPPSGRGDAANPAATILALSSYASVLTCLGNRLVSWLTTVTRNAGESTIVVFLGDIAYPTLLLALLGENDPQHRRAIALGKDLDITLPRPSVVMEMRFLLECGRPREPLLLRDGLALGSVDGSGEFCTLHAVRVPR